MIHAVVFDLDGTLFDRDTSVRKLIDQQYETFFSYLAHIPKSIFVSRFMELEARGYIKKDEVYRKLVEEYNLINNAAQELYDYFYAYYHACCVPFPYLEETLELLQAQGLKLGIITNGGHAFQMSTIRALKIEPYFSAILTSEKEQVRKPDPQIFQRALSRLNASASETVFVGDHPTVDIAGARAAGLKAIWKRDSFWEPPAQTDGTIDNLNELVAALARLV